MERMTPDYEIDENHGFIKQTKIFDKPMVYDVEYVQQRYDTYTTNEEMSRLRFDLIQTYCEFQEGAHFMDIGYGNGSFLKHVAEIDHSEDWPSFVPYRCHGWDISGYPLPDGVQFTTHDFLTFNIVTMFDVLEHLTEDEQRHYLGSIQTRYLVISVPWCHVLAKGWNWFEGWKHRRPDEHLFHFCPTSLCSLLALFNYRNIYLGNPEDAIRKPSDALPNILTAIFQRV